MEATKLREMTESNRERFNSYIVFTMAKLVNGNMMTYYARYPDNHKTMETDDENGFYCLSLTMGGVTKDGFIDFPIHIIYNDKTNTFIVECFNLDNVLVERFDVQDCSTLQGTILTWLNKELIPYEKAMREFAGLK